MPLTALLIIDDADCAFTVLGVPIVEFQMRQAVATGAKHVVMMVGRMPPALHEAIDRLRREGLGVDVARNVGDTIDFVHPDDRVLLVAPRVALASGDRSALAGKVGNTTLAVAAAPETARFDIIDSARRWTGWAAFDGHFLRDVAATIGHWDLAPTILRRLLQTDGAVLMAEAPVAQLDRPDHRRVFETTLRDSTELAPDGLGDVAVVLPVARIAARFAGDVAVRSEWIGWAAFAMALAATGLGLTGWIALPTTVMLVALVGWRTETIMRKALASSPLRDDWFRRARGILIGALLMIVGFKAMQSSGQWGCLVLSLVLVGALALLRTPLIRARNPLAIADAASSLGIVTVASLVGSPVFALAIAALHAVASVAMRQIPAQLPQT